ncbi:hypothetical protein [Streptomyces sp. AC558_RSS880]|uniref:hypothetical protein n=1 Tax=Streptomyces sp. AC558_RSS880 TaxID=2823687 RepID=UPI001C24E932|nr:hypothetical protein [Streptomyces sp. AC558_RSS880]
MPTPAAMAARRPNSAQTRMALESVVTALAESIEADDSIDLDAVVTLTRLVDAVAKLTQAQADYTIALNQRHAQRTETVAQ